jgi:hypothetical protein
MAKQPKRENPIYKEDVRPTETSPQATVAAHVHEHEHSDVDIRAIIKYSVILLASLGVIQLVLWGVFQLLEARAERADEKVAVSPVADSVPIINAPLVQANPAGDMAAFRKSEDSVLDSYRLIDKGTGTVRLPINTAVELLTQRGLPARSEKYQPELAPKEQDGGRYGSVTSMSGASQIPGGVPPRDTVHEGTGTSGNTAPPDSSGSHPQ